MWSKVEEICNCLYLYCEQEHASYHLESTVARKGMQYRMYGVQFTWKVEPDGEKVEDKVNIRYSMRNKKCTISFFVPIFRE